MSGHVPRKWRPSLGLLIATVVVLLVILPFAALVGSRITSTQFVRETEANLHAQAAIYAAIAAHQFRAAGSRVGAGTALTAAQREALAEPWRPIGARLGSDAASIKPPRPETIPPPSGSKPALLRDPLSLMAQEAQKTTLVGFMAVDHRGQIVSASGYDRGTLAHIEEVAQALSGEITSTARWRTEEYRNHSLRSISRDTRFRVYVAHPIVVEDHVVGAVYLSRTPSNLNKYLYQQRETFLWLFTGIVLTAAIIGLFLWRFLTRPLSLLQDQAQEIAAGKAHGPVPRYGASELAGLGQSLLDMAASLRRKSAALESYTKHATHELKSPVTSILGAAELLSDATDPSRRDKLVRTIQADASRMDRLLLRMREMVQGQSLVQDEDITLDGVIQSLRVRFADLDLLSAGDTKSPLPLPKSAMEMCARHILENAREHGAQTVSLSYSQAQGKIIIEDDGEGLSEANVKMATVPFFTTKRETGGTGMGLSIVSEIIAQFDGTLAITNGVQGAKLTLHFSDKGLHGPSA